MRAQRRDSGHDQGGRMLTHLGLTVHCVGIDFRSVKKRLNFLFPFRGRFLSRQGIFGSDRPNQSQRKGSLSINTGFAPVPAKAETIYRSQVIIRGMANSGMTRSRFGMRQQSLLPLLAESGRRPKRFAVLMPAGKLLRFFPQCA